MAEWHAIEGRYVDGDYSDVLRPLGLANSKERANAICQRLRWEFPQAQLYCRRINETERIILADEFLKVLEGERGGELARAAHIVADCTAMFVRAAAKRSEADSPSAEPHQGQESEELGAASEAEKSDADWRRELPFLQWTADGSGVIANLDDEGRWGFRTVDGKSVTYGTDPRLAGYEAHISRKLGKMIREQFIGPANAAFAAISNPDDPEPFPQEFIREKPEFIAWLNGHNPDYSPTIAEYKILYPAYQERLRKLRERAISSPTGSSVAQQQSVAGREKLNKTALAALHVVEKEGPIQGKALAKRIKVEFSTLRKHIIPRLKKCGVKNDGDGYYVPSCSAT